MAHFERARTKTFVAGAALSMLALAGCNQDTAPVPTKPAPSQEALGDGMCDFTLIKLNRGQQDQMLSDGQWLQSLPEMPAHDRLIAVDVWAGTDKPYDPLQVPQELTRIRTLVGYFFAAEQPGTDPVPEPVVASDPTFVDGVIGFEIYDQNCADELSARAGQPRPNGQPV